MLKLLNKIWEFIKAFFKNNSKQLDKFSEKLFAKGVDELVKALSKTLPKTKKQLMNIIEKNFVNKFKNVPLVGNYLEDLFKAFEVKVNSTKLSDLVKVFGEFAKQWFNNLYKG